MSSFTNLYRNDTNVSFLRLWRPVLMVSAALIVISLAAVLFRGFNLGLDFEGGAAWEVSGTDISTDDARDALRPLGYADARVQTGDGVLRVRAELSEDDSAVESVTQALMDATGVSRDDVSLRVAGPSWGDEITNKARNALIVFFIVIAIYITVRLRWQMAVGALAAVVHDILITVGIYALFQFEITPPTIIAFLTIMGYSLYDTLVVFDKARDNEHRYGGKSDMSYPDIMNLSLNQVLARSINTSITSLLPVASVLVVGSVIMGAVTLREFAVALLIGLLAGTFSSIFVAAPLATWLWGDRELEAREVRVTEGSRNRGSTGRGPVGKREGVETKRASRRQTTATAVKDAPPDSVEPQPSKSAQKAKVDKAPEPQTAKATPKAAPSGAIPARPRKKKRKK